jgi:hypothetical protein
MACVFVFTDCWQASLIEINLPKAAVEVDRIVTQLQLHKASPVPAAKSPAQSETKSDAQPENEAVPNRCLSSGCQYP